MINASLTGGISVIRVAGVASLLTSAALLAGCVTSPQIAAPLERDAMNNDAAAQYAIGMKYFEAWNSSFGRNALLEEARRWFAMAAENGDPRAHYRMARICGDRRQSVEWLQLPAQHGVAEAQHELGIHYAQAWGTRQDLVQAYKWMALAFEGNVPNPIGKLADLDWLVQNGRMSPDQIAEGQRLAKEHSALHGTSRPIARFE